MIACCSSRVPAVGVYLVLPARMASAAARLIFSGVSKSGSPAPKSTTFAPAARSASAACIAASVDEGFIFETLSETGKAETAGCVIINSRSSLGAQYNTRCYKRDLAQRNFFFHTLLDQRGHQTCQCTSQKKNFLDQSRADVR